LKIINGLDAGKRVTERSVLTVGNFDGVHRGHQKIAAVAREHAREAGIPTVALTFEPHPLNIVRPEMAPQRLTSPEQKLAYLRDAGFDLVVVARSAPEFLSQPPEVFIRDIIVGCFHPRHIVEGGNFGFGKGRRGNVETLRQFASEFGYHVHVVDPVQQRLADGSMERVSSSLIRGMLGDGQVSLAAGALGREYALRGTVVEGAKRGRPLGFPTANLDSPDQMIPADGVYTAMVDVEDGSYRGAISIGTTPTFDGQVRKVEAHLIDFDGDLYGRTITIRFRRWLRGQRKFASKEELMGQIAADVREAGQEVAGQAP
jgi:riboflavin kinase/FMN adenylyltransferase